MNKKSSTVLYILITSLFYSLLLPSPAAEKKDDYSSGPNQGNEVVIEWNRIAFEIAKEMYSTLDQVFEHFGGLARTLAMMHIAVHDALNSISPEYETYAFKNDYHQADPVAAVSQSAHDILVHLFPHKKKELDYYLQKWLNKITDEAAKESGVELGKKTASAITKLRLNDGYKAELEYKPQNIAGKFYLVPGFDWVLKPHLRFAKPFALKSEDQFRASPPPSLISAEYARAFIESKEYGSVNSKIRTQDQTYYAHWWAEFAEPLLNKISILTAKDHNLGLWETARLLAVININIFDLYIASWDSKYHYDTWRPVTAIHRADEDGNPGTEKDPDWQPEMGTPPFPEYPSLHSSIGSSCAEILTEIYGTPDVYISLESNSALPENKIRSYNILDVAAEQCADSRVMNGFHFRFSTEAGLKMGRDVAGYILSNYLKPLQKEISKKSFNGDQ